MKLQRLKLTTLQGLPSRLKPQHQQAQTNRLRGRAGMERLDRLRRRNPLCRHCHARGITRAADQYDHVVPLWKGGADEDANMQGLCLACHEVKTAAEATARAATDRASRSD